ncbi:NUP188 [Candida oxycetoniae]|uniref:Nucleoporin NUP188 n=1 Tax=Candida oxycetoniae TaxID=497107 RepID=A0AAI9WVZ0_9ASCO|nr:NUP188 [Candida oxycetoniae]KAI3402661.2 NUP188 [Candida oxycetoniae]
MSSLVVDPELSKQKLPLKPIQPTQFWTFENALALIKDCQDPYILEALNEFLLLAKDLLLDPTPFAARPQSKTKLNADSREITLRGILYTDITKQNIEDAELLAKYLELDVKEVVRVISQTSKKIPAKPLHPLKFKSKISDDKEHQSHNDRIRLYIWNILRERRIILRIASESLSNKTNQYASSVIRNLGKEIFLSKSYFNSLIKSVRDISVKKLMGGTYKSNLSNSIDETIHNETVLFCIESCKLLFEIALQNPLVTKEAVKDWFDIMRETDFAVALGSKLKYHESFEVLQALYTVISIEFLDLENTFDSLNAQENKSSSYMGDLDTFCLINSIITSDYNYNPVLLFSWSIILLRKLCFLQEFPDSSVSKAFNPRLTVSVIDNEVNQINKKCLNLNVFGFLQKINETLHYDNRYSASLATIITSSISLLELTPDVTTCIVEVIRNCPNNVVEQFFSNEAVADAIIIAKTKFPLLLTPYIKLTSINGNVALHEFNYLKSYIQVFKKDEFDKLYQIDDQNLDLVKIKSEVTLNPPFESNRKLTMALAPGTKAKLLPAAKSDEVLVTFLYQYNGWAFLGRILQNILKLNSIDSLQEEILVDILNLTSNVAIDNEDNEIKLVLEAMSAYTDNSDIIEVILRFLEMSLHQRNVKVLPPIIKLLTNLVPFVSNQIWSYLSKSSLFSRDGKEQMALKIFGAVEMINGDYEFSLSLVKFASVLVADCISLDETFSEQSKSNTMTKLVHTLMFLFENFTHCRFNCFHQQLELGVLLLDLFSTILTTTYGIENGLSMGKGFHRILHPASVVILDSFLATDINSARTSLPLLNTVVNVSENLDLYELTDTSGFWYDSWIRCSFSFTQLVLSLRSLLNFKPSALERELLQKAVNLVKIFAEVESYRKIVLDLLSCLISGKWDDNSNNGNNSNNNNNDRGMPSFLSHLGTYNAQVLKCSVAAGLDNSFDDYKIKISIHDFVCAVMRSNQQGLIILFNSGGGEWIRGATEMQSGNNNKNENNTGRDTIVSSSGVSIVELLKKNVREMKYYPNSVSVHLVDALALACNSWSTVKEYKYDEEFIKLLIGRVKLQITDIPTSPEMFISRCYELKLVAKIADILALYLFTTKNEKCQKQILEFVNSDNFIDIAKKKFEITHYQSSLHLNLEEAFKNAYPNFKLSQFTTALGKRNRVGVNVIYNLALMDTLFKSSGENWVQIREQIIASSINIQFITSQLESAKSFGILLTSFCRRYEGVLNVKLLGFINFLFQTNIIENIPSEQFQSVYSARIELGFYLIYSFYKRENKLQGQGKPLLDIIKSASTLLSARSSNNYANSNASGGSNETRGTYRQLLRTIFCALKFIEDDSSIITEFLSLFKDLFESIVTKRIKMISIEVQHDVSISRSGKNNEKVDSEKLSERLDDLSLILSVLKVFTNLKSNGSIFQRELTKLTDESRIVKTLLNMYANSIFLEPNDESSIARLSLEYLRQLMSIRSIAENIIESGLFIVLLQSPVSRDFRAGGLSIMHEPKAYQLWVDGVLPLLITCIRALGPCIFPEIRVVLSFFSKQILYVMENWSGGAISTAGVAETNQILVIYDLLSSVSVEDASTDGSFPVLDSEDKREELSERLSNLLKHPKYLRSRIVRSNEHQVVDDQVVKNIVSAIRDMVGIIS